MVCCTVCRESLRQPEHRIMYTIYNEKYIAYIGLKRNSPSKRIVGKKKSYKNAHCIYGMLGGKN